MVLTQRLETPQLHNTAKLRCTSSVKKTTVKQQIVIDTTQCHCKHSNRAARSNTSQSCNYISCAAKRQKQTVWYYRHTGKVKISFPMLSGHTHIVSCCVHCASATCNYSHTARYVPNARVPAGGEVAVHFP